MGALQKSRFFALISLFGGVILLYQNCGEVGGQSPFGSINQSSTNCDARPYECQGNGLGDVSKLKLNFTTGDLGVFSISKDAQSATLQGTCDSAGFRRTAIRWTLTDTSGRTLKSAQDSTCNEKTFSLAVPFSQVQLKAGLSLKLKAQLIGLDNFDNPYAGKTSSSLTLNVIDLILEPILDSRATCQSSSNDSACASNLWTEVPDAYYLLAGKTNLLTLGTNGTPPVRGFCQFRTTTTPSSTSRDVKLRFRETGLPAPNVTSSVFYEISGNPAVKCLEIPAGQKRHSNTAYNGYFNFTNGVPLQQGTVLPDGKLLNSRHFRIGPLMMDSDPALGGSREVESQRAIEVHLRYQNSVGGRGWTFALARSAIELMHMALMFTKSSYDGTNDAIDFMNTLAAVPTDTFRKWLVAKKMLLVESVENGNVTISPTSGTISDPKFLKTLFDVARGGRSCDTALASSFPQLPDFDLGGVISNSDSTLATKNKRAATRLSVCLTYWLFQGALNRNSDDLSKSAMFGMSYNKNASSCTIYGMGTQIPQDVCGVFKYHYTVIKRFADRVSTTDLASTGSSGITFDNQNRFYRASAQFYLNYLMATLACSNPLISSELQVQILRRVNVTGSDTLLGPFAISEDNSPTLPNVPFASYDVAPTCGSAQGPTSEGSYL